MVFRLRVDDSPGVPLYIKERERRACKCQLLLEVRNKHDWVMTMTTEQDSLSPLDQIRQTEAEVTRDIAAARKEAELTVAEAKDKAAQLKAEAYQTGSRKGQEQYKKIIARADVEAKALTVQAHQRAGELKHRGEIRMGAVIKMAVNFIIGGLDH